VRARRLRLFGWIIEQQALFTASSGGGVRRRPCRGLRLVGLSFLYGVFRAGSRPRQGGDLLYIVATGETVRRGVMLAALSSLVQAHRHRAGRFLAAIRVWRGR
jgi:ABC-type nickel/cobalt efflux system permease component RcnA